MENSIERELQIKLNEGDVKRRNGSKCSRMNQIKFVEGSP